MRTKRLVPVCAAALSLSLAAADAQAWVHPQAAAQPTARGRTINTLQAWRGGLYAGYGDYELNTGPVAIARFNTATHTFGAPFWAATEEIDAYRVMDGRLYAPYTDALGHDAATPDYAVSGWSQANVFASAHVFDAAYQSTTGALWMAGADSDSPNGTVWRSLDHGATWKRMLSVPPPDGDPENFVRFYFIAAYHGKIIAQPASWFLTPMQAFVYADGAWKRRPALGPYSFPYHAEKFADKLLYQSYWDGSLVVLDQGPIHGAEDYVKADNAIWVLDGLGVYKTSDLLTWTQVATAPGRATSIAVTNGAIWVGTSQAEILRLN
jgi:hypothetical protein